MLTLRAVSTQWKAAVELRICTKILEPNELHILPSLLKNGVVPLHSLEIAVPHLKNETFEYLGQFTALKALTISTIRPTKALHHKLNYLTALVLLDIGGLRLQGRLKGLRNLTELNLTSIVVRSYVWLGAFFWDVATFTRLRSLKLEFQFHPEQVMAQCFDGTNAVMKLEQDVVWNRYVKVGNSVDAINFSCHKLSNLTSLCLEHVNIVVGF